MKHPIRTLLAFDFGLRNIGVAIGQAVTGTANALPPLKAQNGTPNWEQIAQLIQEWQPDAFVVGIPLNMDGSDSTMSQRARKFGNRLYGRFGKPWFARDERLSSFEAKDWARKLGHDGNYTNAPIDSLAAQLILESWLNSPDGQAACHGNSEV